MCGVSDGSRRGCESYWGWLTVASAEVVIPEFCECWDGRVGCYVAVQKQTSWGPFGSSWWKRVVRTFCSTTDFQSSHDFLSSHIHIPIQQYPGPKIDHICLLSGDKVCKYLPNRQKLQLTSSIPKYILAIQSSRSAALHMFLTTLGEC
jgi:hypothetical protein